MASMSIARERDRERERRKQLRGRHSWESEEDSGTEGGGRKDRLMEFVQKW